MRCAASLHGLGLLLALSALGCGGAPTTVATRPVDVEPVAPAPTPTPFPRATALPPAPRMVAEVDMELLRQTPLWAAMRAELDGTSSEDTMGRAVVEVARRVTFGMYGSGDDTTMVFIARGVPPGVVARTVEELHARDEHAARVDRMGLVAWYLSDDMVASQPAEDEAFLAFPEHLDELLRTAAGQAPATPLPEPLRAFEDRPFFAGAPLRMRFLASERPAEPTPLAVLVGEAGSGAVAGRVDGDWLAVVGSARAPSEARAAQLAIEVEAYARGIDAGAFRSAALAEAMRTATVRTDGAWVEVEVRFPISDLGDFMGVVAPLYR